MNQYITIIDDLSANQAYEFLELLGDFAERQPKNDSNLWLNASKEILNTPEKVAELKGILFLIASLPNPTGRYLRQQLIDNASYLEQQRQSGPSRAGATFELLSYVALLLALLQADFELKLENGKLFISIGASFISPLKMLHLSKGTKTNEAQLLDSEKEKLQREVFNLIETGEIKEAIRFALEATSSNSLLHHEILLLSAQLEKNNKEVISGLVTKEESDVKMSRIAKSLIATIAF